MKNLEFRNNYLRIPRIENKSIIVRNEIIEKCKISKPTFYNWLRGITPIPHWAKPIISEIMNKEQSELFPDPEHKNK